MTEPLVGNAEPVLRGRGSGEARNRSLEDRDGRSEFAPLHESLPEALRQRGAAEQSGTAEKR